MSTHSVPSFALTILTLAITPPWFTDTPHSDQGCHQRNNLRERGRGVPGPPKTRFVRLILGGKLPGGPATAACL